MKTFNTTKYSKELYSFIQKEANTKKIISLLFIILFIILKLFSNLNLETVGLVIFPSIMMSLYNKNGIVYNLLYSITTMIIAFLFWGKYSTQDIITSLTGGCLAFVISTSIYFIYKRKTP